VEITTLLQAENIATLNNQTKERITRLELIIAAGDKTYVLPSSFADLKRFLKWRQIAALGQSQGLSQIHKQTR
jgi:hypothetical protein